MKYLYYKYMGFLDGFLGSMDEAAPIKIFNLRWYIIQRKFGAFVRRVHIFVLSHLTIWFFVFSAMENLSHGIT